MTVGCFNRSLYRSPLNIVSLFVPRPYNTGFVRDHLRYVDEIVCAAARVVEAVREHARKNKNYKPSMEEGVYDAMHVR